MVTDEVVIYNDARQAEPWMAEREGRERVGMHVIPTRRVRERPVFRPRSDSNSFIPPSRAVAFFDGGEGGIRTLVTR